MTTSPSFAKMANNQSISLSSALRANTPPTKGQTTSRKFLTLSIFFRFLLVMFLTLTASTAWGAEGDIIKSFDCTVSSKTTYARYTPSCDGITWNISWGQTDYIGTNKSTNYANLKISNGTDLNAAKGVNSSINSSTQGYVTIIPQSAMSRVGKITISCAALSGSPKVYVVSSTSLSTSYSQIKLKTGNGLSAQGATMSTSGLTFEFDTQTQETYYAVVLYSTAWYRLTETSIEFIEGASAPTTYTVTLNPNYPEGKTGVFKDKSNKTINGNLVLSYPSGTASMQITSLYNSLTLDGYDFGGWYNAKGSNPGEVSGSPCTNTGNITGDKTYYAKWTQKVYTVTATSNNNNYGTVSVSGTTITASPKTGYTYANPAYTVTSGTATVTQNGDIFTVTPSTNCTIRINFEAKPKYTVTLVPGSGSVTNTELEEESAGAGVILPTPTLSSACQSEGWSFAGWKTTSAVATETTTKPTLIAAGTYKPTSNINLYAVYQRTETTNGGGNSEESVDFSQQGYTNEQTMSSYTGNDFEIAFNKGTNSNAPKYYSNGTAIRIYGGGYFTISSESTITKIVITFGSSDGSNAITTDGGSYSNGTWTGSANSVKFTIGGTSGNRRIAGITVTTSGGSSTTTYYHSTPHCATEPSQLAKPTNLQVTNITSTSATLSWGAVANAKWYGIKTGNSLIVSTGSTSSDLSNLEPSTKYTYCVYAVADGYTNSEETCVTFTTAPAAEVVNWSVKGVEYTTEFNGQSTTIYQPTGEELTCGEKKFVGWTANSNYENATNAPTDLFTTTLPNGLTSGTTFYAVYADTRKTTSITYTWDLVQQSTDPALAVGDQIAIAAKDYNYALSTTQNTDNRGAVSVTKDGDKITIDNKVQIFTLENGNEEGTFALATGNGYLSGTRRKAGRNYYNQLITATSKSANTSWYIGFTEETTPYIYNEVSEKKNGSNYEYPNYYVGFNYNYDWWESEYTYYFEAVRDASTWYDYNPENISIYRRTKHENTTTVNSGYTTDCGCTPPQTSLNIENSIVVVNQTLDLSTITYRGGTGGRISQYYCSDAEHTTIAEGHIFSANALGTYEITATQATNNGACETTATFTITVTCAEPEITCSNTETTINTPVDLKSIITSTSTMPLSFAYTGKNVYISGTNFTFLAAGTYTINATQAAGGIYCNGSQEITITVTDPCDGKIKPSVTATANETTITVVWDALDDVTTYRIYNNTTGDSDETTSTTYTFSGLNPSTEYSWTVEAVYSDGCTAAASGTTTTSTPVVTYEVNWNVAGSGYNTGTPTTSVNHGEKVSDLPTTPNPAEHSCGDKAFVGWSKSQYLDGTRPADLFTTAEGSPAITAATTFYAVFADCVTDGGDDTPEDDTQGEWTLVTDMSVLEVGTKIFIAAAEEDLSLSTTQNNNNRAATSIIKSGNTATIDEATQVLTLEAGTKSGTWAFNTGDGYLYAASSTSNYLRTIAELDDNGSWTISVTNTGIATIKAQGSNTRNWLRKNSNSALFSCYSSGQDDVVIYYKSAESTPVDPTEYTVTLSVLGETSEENTTSNYTLPIDVDASCAGKTFVGWTTTANLSSPTEPISNYWAKGTPVTITEDKTYYAVFAEGTNTFEWVTTGVESGVDYLLAGYHGGNDYVLKNTLDSYGYIETVNINASDNVITTSDNSLIWTIAGNSTLGYYIYNPASDKYLNIDAPFTLDGTAKTRYSITMSKDAGNYVQSYIKYGNDYCYLYNDNTIGIDEAEASIYLYKRAYSDYSTTCDGGGTDPDPDPEPTGNAYVKVTNASSLKAGDKLLLVNESNAVVAGDITSQYLEKVDATISNNTISELPSEAVVLTLGGTAGAWTLANSNGQLLGATAVKKLAWGSGTTTWSISISNGDATIQNSTNSYGRFLYNENDPRFTTYTSDASSTMLLPQIYKLTSTPASAPARKVAMKKAAAMRVEKSEMVTRPVVKAPAALAAQECTSYENYTTICCANPITDLKFAAGANSITLYWNTAAVSATATLYNDEECADQVTGATQSGITNGTCTFTGLAKTTTYYAKVTTTDGCTAVLEVSTERPIVSVAEWAATQINIDINTNEPIRVYLENEVTGGSTTGNQATKLFFSKYYEATANVKLVAVYNGTANTIDLTDYKIKYGKTAWATNYIPLVEFATTANGFALAGYLSPGEEMILYTKNVSDGRDVAIMECVNEAYPDGKWIEVTTTNNTGKGSLSFGGDKVIALFEGNTLIDIIGAGNATAPTISGSSMTKPSWGDAKGWTCDEGLSIDDGTMIGISTNRCLLVRNNTVTSGAYAVEQNEDDFVTLCTEWKGAHVPDDDIDDGVAASCENFAFVGTFDYSDYYVKYEELVTSDELPADGRLEDGTYRVATPDLHDIACTNMRISVKSGDGKTTLVTQDYKVPIIVDQDIQTDNEIYFHYTQRTDVDVEPDLDDKNENVLTPDICAECDIVIRDSKTLTHVAGGKGQFRNMMVYPNAKMDNQAEQPFNLNTLQMQGKNDEVSYAIIENDGSTIDVGDMVFVKRIDDKYWYNFSLPYDCKVADIIQQNGQSMGKYWVDWGIKEYDGKARQAYGTSAGAGNVGLYWKKVEETATLKAHQGYIIGLFTTEWTNQMKFVYFTPTNTNPYRESGDDAKNTTIDSWYTSKTVAARHRGWNFTGSPYISRFGQGAAGQGLNNTSLIMTGYPEPENINVTEYETYTENVYVTIPSTQGGKYYSHSVASGVELLPFTAYFVQAADVDGSTDTPRTLTYAKGNRALPNAVPARAAATKQRVLAELLVTAPDGQTDNTGVWVDERYTPEYEIAADLGKMYVAGAKPQLYTLAENGEMMAYHALPDACAMNIPLRLYAPKAGDYTLTLNQRVSRLAGAERVELLYNNAVVANMMLQDYTITANRGTVNGYSLSIARRADVSTAIDNITGTAITVIANDGYISVTDIPTDAQVSVYDMLGRLLATQSANGQTVVNIPAVPQGVYNIVVGNNNGHTTIKTVIK